MGATTALASSRRVYRKCELYELAFSYRRWMLLGGVVMLLLVNMGVETSGARLFSSGVEGKLESGMEEESARPVVLWHGMGDACCEKRSLLPVVERVKQKLGADARVESLVVASGKEINDDDASTFSQVYSSFFGNALKNVVWVPK